MSNLPNRDNPYNFDEYLSWRDSFDMFADDEFLQRVIATYAPDLTAEEKSDLQRMGKQISAQWKHWADEGGKPENAPYMEHYGPFNNRIDRIVRPEATLKLEKAIYQEGIFARDVSAWVTFIKIFMFCQLGESGINCSHCCTGGLIRILEKFDSSPETDLMLEHMREGIDGDYGIASQFLSEIQGGSDVAANCVEAVKTDDGWRIYGTKFYCSAAHSDYALITAKPTDSSAVAVFVVPSWLPGDKEKEKRNNYTINKLKSKLGTRELPTAEITYNGAVAYQVGELERGLANIVGIVLSHSRFITGISAGAQLTRMAREARGYSEFRKAFGVTIKDFGLVASQMARVERGARRCTAGAFKMQSQILRSEAIEAGELDLGSAEENERAAFDVRILVMMQKLVACSDSAVVSEEAMSILGANGLMEDFSALPRLYRDAVVLGGAWEGPRNLLLTRIYMDMQKAAAWYPPEAFLGNLLAGSSQEKVADLAIRLEQVLSHGTLFDTAPETLEICDMWDKLCADIIHEYQDNAVNEVLSDKVQSSSKSTMQLEAVV
ncbi:MAG: acyl-CoA dehydrogenase family protein [Pseudomonadota bacterium]